MIPVRTGTSQIFSHIIDARKDMMIYTHILNHMTLVLKQEASKIYKLLDFSSASYCETSWLDMNIN